MIKTVAIANFPLFPLICPLIEKISHKKSELKIKEYVCVSSKSFENCGL